MRALWPSGLEKKLKLTLLWELPTFLLLSPYDVSLYISVCIYELKDMLASKYHLLKALLGAKLRMKRVEPTKYYYLVEKN